MNLNQVTLPSTDIARSKCFYNNMGFDLIVDSAEYIRFECPDGESTFSLHKVDRTVETGVVIYFEVVELDALVRSLSEKGVKFDNLPRDESWLWREARLKDPDGNMLCLFFAGDNRKYPPWRVANPPA